MAKKARFKYKEGQSVKFSYYDGSVHNGIIHKAQYRNEDSEALDTQWTMPVYTVHSPDTSGRYSRGYMSYPCITENMIKNVLDTDIKIVPLKDYVAPKIVDIEKCPIPGIDAIGVSIQTNDLEDAIKKQKEFIDGKVKK